MSDLANIEHLEADLWDAADNLRANSKLTAGEYCMPVLGVIFLRHATNRYNDALREIKADQAVGKMPKRPLTAADFKKRRALLLPKEARYDELLALPKGASLGTALVDAMNAIERDFEPLLNQLPKEYTKFENSLLEDLLRVFDSETLRTAGGDVFGRINEYFLMKFAMQGAQDNGEFFKGKPAMSSPSPRDAGTGRGLGRGAISENVRASSPRPSPPAEGGEGVNAPLNTQDHVLMIDARNIYRKVTRKIYDFTPEQQQNLAAIVWRVYQHVCQQSASGMFAGIPAAP